MKPERLKLVVDIRARDRRSAEMLFNRVRAVISDAPGCEAELPPATYYALPDDAPLGARLPEGWAG